METRAIQLLVLTDGQPGALSLAELKKLLSADPAHPAPVPTPEPVPLPVFVPHGTPRQWLGARESNQVYAGAGLGYLLEVFTQNGLDCFLPRGYNLPYSGPVRLAGAATGNNGTDAPKGFVMPTGYEKLQFDDGAVYYRQTVTPVSPEKPLQLTTVHYGLYPGHQQ